MADIPEFIWNGIFNITQTLICGLIVAYFTSTFLKEKEERTRIAGIILEKRLDAEQEILHFLEYELFKEEINIENSSKYDVNFDEHLKDYDLPVPYDGAMQYARIFASPEMFEEFFHDFEEQLMEHKLWLDSKVKEHLVYMQLYFGFFNTIPLMLKRIPLPEGNELTEEEFYNIQGYLLLLFGHCCDKEINKLMSELDEKVVDSVYKLELSRPKESIMRDNLFNVDMQNCLKRLEKESIPGKYQHNFFQLIFEFVYATKNIDIYDMTGVEYDEFLKSAAPKVYEKLEDESENFCKEFEKVCKEHKVKVVRKSDIDKYPEMYGITLREILNGQEPVKNKHRKK